MNRRYLLWAALVIAVVIAVRPMYWLGIIGFAGLMVVLAVFVGLVVTYLLSLKKGSLYREIGFGVLIVVVVCAVITLKFSAPELSAGEVKTELSSSFREAVSAEYRGGGIWKVVVRSLEERQGPPYVFEGHEDIVYEGKKYVVEGDVYYLYYDENTKKISTK